jgi:iron complex transport system substrate-binding protein
LRIVSLCPSNTETLAFMGLAHYLVGTDKYSDWPLGVEKLPKLGSDLDIDMDAVVQLKPDLILASLTVPGMEKNIERLDQKKLPYVLLNPNSIEEIGENLLTLGETTDHQREAKEAYDRYIKEWDMFRELSRHIPQDARPSLYWEWWSKPVYTPGGGNWLTEISELAGGRNVFADNPLPSVQTDWDTVLEKNPDYIFLAWVGIRKELVKPELVKNRPGWSDMAAIRGGELHIMEEPLYCRPSPRLFTGLRKLGAMLHPQQYPAYNEDPSL